MGAEVATHKLPTAARPCSRLAPQPPEHSYLYSTAPGEELEQGAFHIRPLGTLRKFISHASLLHKDKESLSQLDENNARSLPATKQVTGPRELYAVRSESDADLSIRQS